MKRLMLLVVASMVSGLSAIADETTATWFTENVATVSEALTAEGATSDGVWSNLVNQVTTDAEKVLVDSDDATAVAYRPNAALEATNATFILTGLAFDAARKVLPELVEDAQAAVVVTTNAEGACVFAVVDNGAWVLTETAADPVLDYTIKIDFAYAASGNAVRYSLLDETGWVALKTGVVKPQAAKISTVEFAGSGSFAMFAGTHSVDAVPVLPGARIVCDTLEEASNVLKKAELVPSAEVAVALGSDKARQAYRDMFGFDIVPASDGKWAVGAFLKPEEWTNVVKSAQNATLQLPIAALVAWPSGDDPINVRLTDCVPGFYYSLYDGAVVTGLKADFRSENCNILCDAEKTVVLPVVTPPPGCTTSGFFSIGVLEVPSVIPGETETATNLPARPRERRKEDIL